MAFGSLAVVLINAWMGARVVFSGLHPGVLTTHLALAMALTGMLVYCAWRGTDHPWRADVEPSKHGTLRLWAALLLVATVAEGLLGAQVREMTDVFAKFNTDVPRSAWIGELENTGVYLLHRSFSWVILGMTIVIVLQAKKHIRGGPGRVGWAIFALVMAQMVLGVVMSWLHIYAWVQVLHVGLAAVLLTFLWLWNFGLTPARGVELSHDRAAD